MPDGRVQRIDEKRDVVYIVRGAKRYAAPLSEVETRARVASARVRFDLHREHGVESAVNVRLRRGTRSNRRQRRFGDLTGARRPGAKIDTAADAYGIDVTTQPLRVIGTWLKLMEDTDIDGVITLYLPDAELHTETTTVDGRRRMESELERHPLFGVGVDDTEINGADQFVRLGYRVDGVPKEDYFVVERGAICDHWIDSTPDLVVEGEDVPAAGGLVEVVRDSAVPDRSVTYAEGKLLQQAERSGRPVRFARVKLALAHNPTNSRPALVEATLETDRFLVRAQASAAELNEAVDLVMDKLTSRIEQQHDRRRHWHGGTEPIPGSWRHGNLRRETSNHFERPQQEREVVRHKSFAPDKLALDEAIWDMALLDYDFFLFVESTTGEDALLERDLGGGLFLRFRDGRDPGSLLDEFDDVAPSIVAVPELSVAEAIALLDAGGGDHLQFFTNRSTGRGNVLYRRFDGHYGLITPPA